MFTKKIMAAAVATVASLGLAASAQATIGPVGAVSGHSDSAVLSGFIECESDLAGSISSTTGQRPAGQGGFGYITSGSFYNCDSGSVTPNFGSTGWKLDATPTSATTNAIVVSGINVTLNNVLGFINCTYTGTLNGVGNETNDTITLSNAGGLTEQTSNFFCPETPSFSAVYNMTPSNLDAS